MLIKGEGGPKNASQALVLYGKSAQQGDAIALNGLGYIYYHGTDVEKNYTKAFEYFQAAADRGDSGDSFFNLAFCHHEGVGTPKDEKIARSLYLKSAQKFGHFSSIYSLALMSAEGVGTPRSARDALYYYRVAVDIGPWHGSLRRGLDQYLFSRTLTSSISSTCVLQAAA